MHHTTKECTGQDKLCNVIDSNSLNRLLNPLWRMNTNSTELPVIVLHLWDRGSRDVEETRSGNKEIVSCIESCIRGLMK